MHESTREQLRALREEYPNPDALKVADLGAYNINGAVKDIWPNAVGYDVVEGPGVDHVIRWRNTGGRFEISTDHVTEYDLVISCNAMQFCPHFVLFAAELAHLCRKGGAVYLTMCCPKCPTMHSTSPNPWGWGDGNRLGARELHDVMSTHFSGKAKALSAGHCAVTYQGVKR